ncbi:MAG: 4Fe-4S dicluster domain-containing protein [Candidatus Omnitrophota bacterium]
MAKTVLKSLFRKPYTVLYPFGTRIYRGTITRGSVGIDIKACIFCGNCERKCPTKAITVSRDTKGWGIDRLKCITCGYCVESCPKKCLALEKDYTPPSGANELKYIIKQEPKT